MRPAIAHSIFAVLGLCLLLTMAAGVRATAAHDGNWSVLIVTEQGGCDRGYRYNVNINNGHVSYQGDASVDLSGTVGAAPPKGVSVGDPRVEEPTSS